MKKVIIMLSFIISAVAYSQNTPPQWSANGYNYSGWDGSQIDSQFIKTEITSMSSTEGNHSQLFAIKGKTEFNGIHFFDFSWKKSINSVSAPENIIIDYKLNELNGNLSKIFIEFWFGEQFTSVMEKFYIEENQNQWDTIIFKIPSNSTVKKISYIEYRIGFEGDSEISGDYTLLLDNLRFAYADTNVLIDGFGDGLTTLTSDEKINLNSYSLFQNYPNPFNPTTTISYSIPNREFVELKVYDLLGNQVANLVNEFKSVGSHSVNFNASNLSSGIYFYKLKAGNYIQTKKLILLK